MKRFVLSSALLLLAACGSGAETPPPSDEAATTLPADSTQPLEGTPRAGVVDVVQQRADQAEADMAERARDAEAQVRAAEGADAPRP